MSSVDQCILISGDRGIHLRLRATEQSSFTHISMFRFIRNFKVPILFNRQLCVNMGGDRGGLLLLDGTVYILCLYRTLERALCIRRTRTDADGRGRTRTFLNLFSFNFLFKFFFGVFFCWHTLIYGANWNETSESDRFGQPPPPHAS